MKNIIYYLGIIFLALIFGLNLIYTAILDNSEHIQINNNQLLYIFALISMGIFIFIITRIINFILDKEKNIKKRKILFIFFLIFYIFLNIIWCIIIRPAVVADQIHVYNLAQIFYSENNEGFLYQLTYAGIPLIEYIQAYPQQITLAFVYNILFRIIHFDGIEMLRVLNIVGNFIIFLALYKICNQISKKYKTNKTLLLFLIITFFSLTMLSTFVYGDIPSLALCLLNVYFAMKYVETNKYSYIIGSSLVTMIAYMMRMNSLIFIIATVIYLILAFLNNIKTNTTKKNIINVLFIIIYICISILPSNVVKLYYIKKYELNEEMAYPNTSFFLIGMSESWRANGWYNESIGELALKNPIEKKEEYKDEIKDRIMYFKNNLGYTFNFYIMKIASMWTENTYSAIQNNNVKEMSIGDLQFVLTFHQKVLLLFMSMSSIIILIQQRKNISLELLFLITIFIGGFCFHILWEAKSRYIIPYIVVLIPISSIEINITRIKENFKKMSDKKDNKYKLLQLKSKEK